ncbi:dioxygenase [Hirsutella rhossiliensis]|uniref:Dioxygenase domain-containing protein n=1 Tax=Hirsutella rhossiliensis TaxID=111463 RepID=A0A9P8N4Q2_9HYPO|nr:dioxygenase domain-containing protein [Hirsutella rhossiliensis]KAH0966885.1 dioxygenase domain-containing protein [Hirsutella rhossiliensis]
MTKLSTLAAVLALFAGVLGHPSTPEGIRAALETRSRVTAHSRRALEKCANDPEALALRDRAVARRAAKAHALRTKRGLDSSLVRRADRESLEKWSDISHNQSSKGYKLDTALKTIFTSNATCTLVPETIIGPYYVEGERIRTNLTDGQAGAATHLDFQFIDINTCKPIPELIIDIWHANATGVYSGVSAKGQGGLDSTHGRGVQKTDKEGVVQFDTVFPGHYVGRTNHFHVMSTTGAKVLPNGTFQGGTAQHIGQTYFDEALIKAVEAGEPYNQNKQPATSNAEDGNSADEATPEYDPFMNYVYLGEQPSDGLLLWTTIAIDPAADYNRHRTAAAHWHPEGGVDQSHRRGSPK